jgi:hypothetical protein
MPRCGQATGPAITGDSDDRKLRKLGRYVVVIDGNRYADYAMAKGRDREATSDSGEALEADRSRNWKRRIEIAEFARRFLSRRSGSNLGLFDDSA